MKIGRRGTDEEKKAKRKLDRSAMSPTPEQSTIKVDESPDPDSKLGGESRSD